MWLSSPEALYLGTDHEPARSIRSLSLACRTAGSSPTIAPNQERRRLARGLKATNAAAMPDCSQSGYSFRYPTFREGYKAILAEMDLRLALDRTQGRAACQAGEHTHHSQGSRARTEVVLGSGRKVPRRALTCVPLRKASPKLSGEVGKELLEKLPDVTVKGDGAECSETLFSEFRKANHGGTIAESSQSQPGPSHPSGPLWNPFSLR